MFTKLIPKKLKMKKMMNKSFFHSRMNQFFFENHLEVTSFIEFDSFTAQYVVADTKNKLCKNKNFIFD